jgi:hypothetical protein
MATLHERHRVPNLTAERAKLGVTRAAVLDRLIGLGVLEDKALRAVRDRGLTDAKVTENIALSRPPHWIEFQDPQALAAARRRNGRA